MTAVIASQPSSDTALAVRTAGSGVPLVLLHGGTGSWSHWARNIAVFAETFRVHAVDLPGFGGSPDVANNIDIDDYIDVVAAAIEAITRGARYHLAGFSFGGVVAAGVAARHGDRIETLTLAGPGGFGNAAGRKLDVRGLPPGGSAETRRAVIRHNLLQMMLAHPASVDEATLDLQSDNIRHARFDSRRVSLAPRLVRDLARSAAPLHVIWGELDHLAYPSIAARADIVRAARPDARIDLVPDAGHWVQYERAGAFNDAFLNFIRSKKK
jgi:pimeloyl-ACP methyl ester carboxylesterase